MKSKTLQTLSAGVRRVSLEAAGVTLSCLLSEPELPPRAAVIAVHGGGMSSGYFDGQAHPDLSLLTLGARLGFTVLSIDRPGYGGSAAALPEGLTLAEQATVLGELTGVFARRYPVGAGVFLLAHSYGGKLAMSTAARTGGLLGMDISGCGHRYVLEPEELSRDRRHNQVERTWGPLSLYPPGTFAAAAPLVQPLPPREAAEVGRWPQVFRDVAPLIRVPLRLTFAEHEAWWRHGDQDVAELAAQLTAVPRLRLDRQPDAGHNISLGRAARSYHLRALGFFEECLAVPARRD